jgi:hypothetical protein
VIKMSSLNIITELGKLGILSGDAAEIAIQLERKNRAEIMVLKSTLKDAVLKGKASILGFQIKPQKNDSDSETDQLNLIIERPLRVH